MVEVPEEVSEYMRTIGSRGGKADASRPKGLAALSKTRRKEIARAGVKARQKAAKAKKKLTDK